MIKKIKSLFYVPKHGKMREQAFLARIALYASVIVLCLGAMGFTAFAYFSSDVFSSSNRITSATYDLYVAATITGTGVDGNVTADNVLEGKQGETYSVTLSYPSDKPGMATSGFCMIHVGDTVYHTAQITQTESTFTLTLTFDTDASVRFEPCWGTSSYFGTTGNPLYLSTGATLTVSAPPAQGSSLSEPDASTDTSTDTSTDASTETSTETSTDTSADTSTDTSADTSTDTSSDTSADISAEPSSDASENVSTN